MEVPLGCYKDTIFFARKQIVLKSHTADVPRLTRGMFRPSGRLFSLTEKTPPLLFEIWGEEVCVKAVPNFFA